MSQTKRLQIRKATYEDAADIAKIQIGTWQYAYKDILPQAYLNQLNIVDRTKKWQEILEHANFAKSTTFVAQVDYRILGFSGICPSRDQDADPTVGELAAIYVDSNHLNKGVGTALMNHALQELVRNSYKSATLWVLRDNHRGRKFYNHHGWRLDGKEKVEQRENATLAEVRYRKDLI